MPQTHLQNQYFILVTTCAECKGTFLSVYTIAFSDMAAEACLRMLLIPITSTISSYHTKSSVTICVPCVLEMQLLPWQKYNRKSDQWAFAGDARAVT